MTNLSFSLNCLHSFNMSDFTVFNMEMHECRWGSPSAYRERCKSLENILPPGIRFTLLRLTKIQYVQGNCFGTHTAGDASGSTVLLPLVWYYLVAGLARIAHTHYKTQSSSWVERLLHMMRLSVSVVLASRSGSLWCEGSWMSMSSEAAASARRNCIRGITQAKYMDHRRQPEL